MNLHPCKNGISYLKQNIDHLVKSRSKYIQHKNFAELGYMETVYTSKEVQIVYRLFLVNYYLLHVPRLPSQLASSGRGRVIDFIWLELPWQYIAMARNNLSIILISLDTSFESMCFNQKLPFLWANLILNTLVGYLRETQQCPFSGRRCTRCCNSSHEVFLLPLHYCIWVVKFPREGHKIRYIFYHNSTYRI